MQETENDILKRVRKIEIKTRGLDLDLTDAFQNIVLGLLHR